MAEVTNMNTLNTRIKLKYDEYTNWTSKNPVLLAGEVAIATIPSGANVPTGEETTMQHLPNVVIKVGDGKTAYNLLPFVSALAADVYGWAKAPEKPTYTAGEIGGLDQFIAGEIQDTDTQYTVQSVADSTYKFDLMKKNKGDKDTEYKHVAYIDLSEVDTRLDALEGRVGDKSVATQIAEVVDDFNLTKLESASGSGKILKYIEQANGLVTAEMRDLVEADIPPLSMDKTEGLGDALAAKQNNLTFTEDYDATSSVVATKKYVDDTSANAVNGLTHSVVSGNAGTFARTVEQENGEVKVTYKALQTADFTNDIVPQAAIKDLDTTLAGKQDALTFESTPSSTNKVATMEQVNAVATTISGLDLTKVEFGNGKVLKYIEQEDGLVNVEARDLVTADFKNNLINESAIIGLSTKLTNLENNKQNNIAWADGYAYDATSNKAATVNYVSSVIKGLNGAMHFEGTIATPEEVTGGLTLEQALINKGITNPQGGDVVLFGYDEYVYDAQNEQWVALGNESIYQTIEQASKDHQALTDAIALKQDILGFDGEYNKETNKVVTVSSMSDAITAAININVASKKATNTVVLGVAQNNGEINVEHGPLTSEHFSANVVPQAAVNGLASALNAKQDNLTFMTGTGEKKVATEEEIKGINEAIAGMNLTQVDATNGHIITGLKQEAGVITASTRELVTADFKDGLINQSAIIDLATTLAGKENAGAATQALNNAKQYADDKIGEAMATLDYTDTAVDGQFVTGINMKDGELTVSRSTVNVKYLTQTTGDYLVFDCGTATI